MDRTGVRRRRLGALLLAGGLVTGFAGTAASASGPFGEDRLVARHRYVVRAGDTLWSIARRRAVGEDPRPVVDAIAEVNQLHGAAIVPGQTLTVP